MKDTGTEGRGRGRRVPDVWVKGSTNGLPENGTQRGIQGVGIVRTFP